MADAYTVGAREHAAPDHYDAFAYEIGAESDASPDARHCPDCGVTYTADACPRCGESEPAPRRVPVAPAAVLRVNDADYEAGHGMEPLCDVQAERGRIAERFATLKPLYGPAKLWEHKRKALLALIEVDLRRSWTTSPRTKEMKLTDASVDAMAHTDPRYTGFLDAAVLEAVEYEKLAVQMGELDERVNRGQAIGRLRAAEAHFAPEGA